MNNKYKNFTTWAKSKRCSGYPKIDWALLGCCIVSFLFGFLFGLALIAVVLP